MPSRAASRFIIATKPSSLPPTVSAIAIAMSFAERTIIIFSASSRAMRVPARKPILLGGSPSAWAETITSVSGFSVPSRSALKVT